MATLKYKEEHNKVGYLLKPTGSDDYHQINDFLSASHIKYALTTNPFIFGSLVKQFWSTATLKAPELGPPAILATINKTPYTITEELGNGNPMPLLHAMLLQAQTGEGAEVATQDIPHPVPDLDKSRAPLPTLSRPQTSYLVAPVLEHDHSSEPHETIADPFLFREDSPLGGAFHTSPPRSSHAPPVGQPSGGEEDHITLTALFSVVLSLVQKVHSLEAVLHDHKKLFKDVVGKLVKKVKILEVKLETKKRKMVVSDSNHEDGTTKNVDLNALRALANAAVAADSDIPSGSTLQIPAARPSVPTAGPFDTSGVPPATFAIPLGASDAPPGASTDLPSASNVSTAASAIPADSLNVPAIVRVDSPNVPVGIYNKGKSLMVDEDIPIKGRTFRQMEEDRLGEEAAKRLHEEEMAQMERAEAQRKRQQERPGPVLEEPSTKRPKSPNVTTPSMHEVPISPAVTSPSSSRTRRKSLGQKHMHKPKSSFPILDLDAPSQTFLKVVIDEDSNDEIWPAVVGWEVLPTPLGEINALYRIDGTTKHFDTLCHILHRVDRQDLMKLYGLVVQYYEHHPATEEVSEEDLKTMMQLVPIKEVYVEALQVKHPIIDWEIHTEGKRTYWKIIRLGGNTVVYQFFVDILKHFDREDLNQL
nr:aminoacyl-tRNA synthetase, class 1a, anticodon-binding [Tanacetum cinerariifolium]